MRERRGRSVRAIGGRASPQRWRREPRSRPGRRRRGLHERPRVLAESRGWGRLVGGMGGGYPSRTWILWRGGSDYSGSDMRWRFRPWLSVLPPRASPRHRRGGDFCNGAFFGPPKEGGGGAFFFGVRPIFAGRGGAGAAPRA